MNARLDKAIQIAATSGTIWRRDDGLYNVDGTRNVPYVVDAEQGFCSCPDKEFNLPADEPCKHILAVELFEREHRAWRKRCAAKRAADPMRGVLLKDSAFMADVPA